MKKIAAEVIVDLKRKLDDLKPRSSERRTLIREAAVAYDISESSIYRQLASFYTPKPARRSDYGQSRTLSQEEMTQYCEVIAALKLRTMNRNGRHISTIRAIEVLESTGIESSYGLLKPEKGRLKHSTVNRYLSLWGFDQRFLHFEAPSVRFQSAISNECWQFDLSPSDLKHLKEPPWYDKSLGKPILMLYSIVDDRSGFCYQEYRNVYGEDASSALQFLFNAMSAKQDPEIPFHGIPEMLYMDNGPIAKSQVFLDVMQYLNVKVKTHMPNSKDKHRTTARAKGKVERAFRTVKEAHEILYHLREPQNEQEANQRLMEYLKSYNDHQHRSEDHSRVTDWLDNVPCRGVREMCNWERFCTFARAPEQRKVGIDARLTIEGTCYEVSPDLAGESVTLWWGLFDEELFVEHQSHRYGPYHPISGPIPLHRFRRFKKTKTEKRLDRLEALAQSLVLPVAGEDKATADIRRHFASQPRIQPFDDPDPFHEISYQNELKARRAIVDYLGKPLATLNQEDKNWIESLLQETLDKKQIMERVKAYFIQQGKGKSHAT